MIQRFLFSTYDKEISKDKLMNSTLWTPMILLRESVEDLLPILL